MSEKLLTIWTGGRRKLGRDAAFGPWVKRVGTIRVPVSNEQPFYYLARAIVYQQLAGAAARTIHGRFIEALAGDVSPERVLRARESTLREAGLSAAKLAAIRDLAAKVRSGEVEVHDLHEQSDDEVVNRLVRVRGIGPWTAQMYLMFENPTVSPANRSSPSEVLRVLSATVSTTFAEPSEATVTRASLSFLTMETTLPSKGVFCASSAT
jgi:3-methyladenine DNA glycosylase/8-oxoguanine DNA glycosylase